MKLKEQIVTNLYSMVFRLSQTNELPLATLVSLEELPLNRSLSTYLTGFSIFFFFIIFICTQMSVNTPPFFFQP